MQLLYSAVSCVGIVALLMLEYMARKSDTVAAPNKHFFCLSIWVIIIVMVSEIITIFFEGTAVQYRLVHLIGNVLGFSLSPFIPLLIGCAIGGFHSRKRLIVFGIPASINLVLTLLSVCFPIIFSVSAENVYMRGSAFGIYVFSYIVALFYLLFQTLFITRCYQNNNRLVPIVLFFFVGVGTMGQVIIPWLHISWLCIAFAIVLYYMYYCDLLHQIDGLTGLLNRRTYECNIHRIDHGKAVAVILFDIDDFKKINDMHGHLFGDRCLVAVSSCIRKSFFRIGLCFRIGGDEFCVIAKNVDQFTVERAYQRFLHEIELMRKAESRLPMVSIGYSFAHGKSGNITDAIFEADQNMYQFKRRRKEQAQL